MSKDAKTYIHYPYFVTLTVVGWTDFFIRSEYAEILAENLRFCQKEKGLEIHCYCLMTNHFHMIASGCDIPINEILKAFKSYTGKKLLNTMMENPHESRKAWLESRFAYLANIRAMDTSRQFWERDNYPEAILNDDFYRQKEHYVHENPVKAGFVMRPEDWYFSSANPEGPLEVTRLD